MHKKLGVAGHKGYEPAQTESPLSECHSGHEEGCLADSGAGSGGFRGCGRGRRGCAGFRGRGGPGRGGVSGRGGHSGDGLWKTEGDLEVNPTERSRFHGQARARGRGIRHRRAVRSQCGSVELELLEDPLVPVSNADDGVERPPPEIGAVEQDQDSDSFKSSLNVTDVASASTSASCSASASFSAPHVVTEDCTENSLSCCVCGSTEEVKRCSKCKTTFYCSKKCQRAHIEYHAEYCSMIADLKKIQTEKWFKNFTVREKQVDDKMQKRLLKLVGNKPMVV